MVQANELLVGLECIVDPANTQSELLLIGAVGALISENAEVRLFRRTNIVENFTENTVGHDLQALILDNV